MLELHQHKETSVLKHRGYQIPELIVFEAADSTAVLAQIDQWLQAAQSAGDKSGFIKQVAYDSHQQIGHAGAAGGYHIALTAFGEAEFKKKLIKLKTLIFANPQASFSFPTTGLFYGTRDTDGKLAYLFAGQGAQYLGMGGALAETFCGARHAWETLGGRSFAGRTIRDMVFPPKEMTQKAAKAAFMRLCDARWASPSNSVAAEAILNLLEKMGVRPDAVAAHSFGDVNALRAAGALTAEDMLSVVRRRGEIGADCAQATRGCIMMVALGAGQIKQFMANNHLRDVWVANFNTPTQTVLAGVKTAVVEAHAKLEQARIPSLLIPISAAPHCLLAADGAEAVYDYLQEIQFNRAQCDVYSFLFGSKVENDPVLFRKMLRANIEKPVRFQTQIEQMHQDGIRTFIEVGPSELLTGLVGQILEGRAHIALNTDQKKGDAVLTFLNVVAELFKQGRVKTLAPLWEGYEIPGQAPISAPNQEPSAVDAEKRLRLLDLEFAKIDALIQERNLKVSAM